MTVLPLGDVKSHLSELVGRVHDQHERVTVTVHGRPSAILIAPEDLEALEETLAIMRDAATMNRLPNPIKAVAIADRPLLSRRYPAPPSVNALRASIDATR